MNATTPKDATRIIASALQMLIDGVRPEGSNYLIVSTCHAYLQFSRDWGYVSMLTEAVSNFYLAPDRQLDQSAINILHDRGFEDPGIEISADRCRSATTATEIAGGAPARSPNYFRYFDVSTPDKVSALADLVAEALSAVYGEDPQMRLKTQLILGDVAAAVADPEPCAGNRQPTPSGDELAWAPWSVRWDPGEEPVIYETVSDDEVATVHGGDVAFQRALLIQRAPTLLEAVRVAAQVLAIMSEMDSEFARGAGREMLPVMQAALYLLDDETG